MLVTWDARPISFACINWWARVSARDWIAITKISKSYHIFKSFSVSDCKLLLKKLQTHANNHWAAWPQCKHRKFNTRNWLSVMIDSTTLLTSCKINFLSCYGPAAFRPKENWKKSTWNNNLHKQDLFFYHYYLFYGPHAAVLIILKKHLPRSVLQS